MTDFATLAQEAVNYLRPELLLLAGKAAESAATESGKQVLQWFRQKLTSKSSSAVLEDAVEHPESDARLQALQQQITILLEENEQLRGELATLLAHQPAVTQVATTLGDNNKTAQAAGSNNTISIR